MLTQLLSTAQFRILNGHGKMRGIVSVIFGTKIMSQNHRAKISFVGLLLALLLSVSLTLVSAQDGGRGDKGTPLPGNRLFSDDFATFVNRWETAETAAYITAYDTQAFHVELLDAEAEVLSQPSTPLSIENFILSASVQFLMDSAPDSLAGIVFGYQNRDNYYIFGVRPTGHYEVRLKQNGNWLNPPLVRGYYPDLEANAETPINLGILYDAGYFELNINDTKLVPFFNQQLTAGEFGLYAFAPSASAHIVFDDYAVFDLVYEGDADAVDTDDVPPTDTPEIDTEPNNNTDTEANTDEVELVKPPRI